MIAWIALAAVNTLIGTGGGGNTCPGPVWPHGMVQPGPDTTLVTKPHDHDPSEYSEADDYRSMCNGYDPRSQTLLGFTQTHLSGTGCTDLQDFLLLPFSGAYPTNSTKRLTARMDKASEIAEAGYYAVTLPDFGVRAELTASKRVAYYRFAFRKGGARIFFDCQAGSFAWWRMHDQNQPRHRVVYSESTTGTNGVIEAYNRVTCWNVGREIFSRFEFSPKPVRVTEMPRNDKCGKRYVLDFDLKPGEVVLAKAAISSVDECGARKNLASDPEGFDFDARVRDCRVAWDRTLSMAEVEGTERQKRIFATALYHAYVQPNLFSDADGRCRFQLLGKRGKVRDSIHAAKGHDVYTTLSTWDTYRAAHPLYTILTPALAGEFAESMVAYADEFGILPKWQMFGGENFCMIGPHSVTIVADAFSKGLVKSDPTRVLKAVEKSIRHYNDRYAEWNTYDRLGYLPCDRFGASVSQTLEWGMVDFAAGRIAELAGDADLAAQHRRRANSYQYLYDAETGLMRGRKSDGGWRTPFEPCRQMPAKGDWNDYTEGGAMQYSWHVLHDAAGLAKLHGGPAKLAERLENLFADNTKLAADQKTGECSGTIGQFALGNEHDQHVPYLWQYAGRPDRAAETIRELCDRYFADDENGLCGNDDCGQISAWYVFACLGFYPLNPVGGEYVLGAPQIPRVTLRLENGKVFTVTAKNLSAENRYVKAVKLNGNPMKGFILHHADILAGGTLEFEMVSEDGFLAPLEGEPVSVNATWCSIGTSITWYNNHQRGFRSGYQERVMRSLRFKELINVGVNGGCVSSAPKSVVAADIYTIEHGVNDWGHGVPVGTLADYAGNTTNGTFAATYRVLIDRIRAVNPKAKIVLCTPRKSYGFRDYLPGRWDEPSRSGAKTLLMDYVNVIRAIAAHEGLPVADFFANCGEEGELPELSIDVALHPNDAGFARMAKELATVMKEVVR